MRLPLTLMRFAANILVHESAGQGRNRLFQKLIDSLPAVVRLDVEFFQGKNRLRFEIIFISYSINDSFQKENTEFFAYYS